MYGASSNSCDTTDFMFPMLADVYYAIISQDEYGKAVKEWVFDRTIACNAQPVTTRLQEELAPEVFLQLDGKLKTRSKVDVRTSTKGENNNLTNILIENVRFPGDKLIYRETAGVRSGRGTIFEISTLEPFVGGLQTVEFYYMLWRRSENQTVGG
jgi:hypothetical protein